VLDTSEAGHAKDRQRWFFNICKPLKRWFLTTWIWHFIVVSWWIQPSQLFFSQIHRDLYAWGSAVGKWSNVAIENHNFQSVNYHISSINEPFFSGKNIKIMKLHIDIQPPCLVRAFSSQPCLITRRYPHNTIWNPMKFHYIPIVVGEISLNPMKSIWLNCLNLTTPPKKSNPYFWWLNPTVSLLFPPLFRPISQWPWHVPQSSSARAVNPIPMSWQPAEPAGSWLRVGCLGLFRGTLW